MPWKATIGSHHINKQNNHFVMKYYILLFIVLGSSLTSFAWRDIYNDHVQNERESTANSSKLLIYFSRADENWQVGYVERGNTAVMVDYIKDLADVDVFEIVPEVAYPAAYDDCIAYVTDEINGNRRPAYKGDINNIADYDTVFVGGPIWWARPPTLFRTFFEAHPELNGKTIIPFGTHGGSGISSYKSLVQEYFPQAIVLESLGISGSAIRNESSKATVKAWLERLGADWKPSGIDDIPVNAFQNGIKYNLLGQPTDGSKGIYIQDGKKFIAR